MKLIIKLITISICCFLSYSIQAQAQTDEEGFQTFEYQEGDTTYVMKQYFICFLKKGEQSNLSEAETLKIQEQHLAHLERLAKAKKICIVGPFGDDGTFRGMAIYNTPTKEEAERLAKEDPAVKAGSLIVEIHPWWAAKGSALF